MCGRFTAEYTWAELHALYSLSDELFPVAPHNMQPRYNIAPTQDVDFIALDKAGNRELLRGRWWLVPFFAKELSTKLPMFNASIETVDTSGAFREPFKKRRCLIPADGYFEWTTSLVDGKKDPWLLQLPEGKLFSFAGLWAHNDDLGITSCTIITAPAVEHIAISMAACRSSSKRAPMRHGSPERRRGMMPRPSCSTTTSTTSFSSIASVARLTTAGTKAPIPKSQS